MARSFNARFARAFSFTGVVLLSSDLDELSVFYPQRALPAGKGFEAIDEGTVVNRRSFNRKSVRIFSRRAVHRAAF